MKVIMMTTTMMMTMIMTMAMTNTITAMTLMMMMMMMGGAGPVMWGSLTEKNRKHESESRQDHIQEKQVLCTLCFLLKLFPALKCTQCFCHLSFSCKHCFYGILNIHGLWKW